MHLPLETFSKLRKEETKSKFDAIFQCFRVFFFHYKIIKSHKFFTWFFCGDSGFLEIPKNAFWCRSWNVAKF